MRSISSHAAMRLATGVPSGVRCVCVREVEKRAQKMRGDLGSEENVDQRSPGLLFCQAQQHDPPRRISREHEHVQAQHEIKPKHD